MYALNALTGTIIWHDNLGHGVHGYPFIWGSPAVYNGSVYIGLSAIGDCGLTQGKFFQMDLATGTILHTFNVVPDGCTGGSVWGSPTIDEKTGMLYFATGNPGRCSQREPYTIALVELQASNLSFVASWRVPDIKGDSDFGSTPTLFQARINGIQHKMIGLINKNGIYYAFDRSNIAAGPLWQDQLALSKKDDGKGVRKDCYPHDALRMWAVPMTEKT